MHTDTGAALSLNPPHGSSAPHSSFSRVIRNILIHPLWLVFALALFLRVGLAVVGLSRGGVEVFTRLDTGSYLEPARALLMRGALYETPVSDVLQTLRPPGMSVFLAGLLSVFDENLSWIVYCLSVLGASVVLPVFLAARLWYRQTVLSCGAADLSDDTTKEKRARLAGLCAATLAAIHLSAISNSPLILSDMPFTVLVAWQLVVALQMRQSQGRWQAPVLGLLAGVAALVRSAGLLWAVPAVVYVGWHAPDGRRRSQIMLFLISFLLCVLPWMSRNEKAGIGWRFDSNVDSLLLFQNCAYMVAKQTGQSADKLRTQWRQEHRKLYESDPIRFGTRDQQLTYEKECALQIIRKAPIQYAREHIQPMVLLPDAPSLMEILGVTQSDRGTLDVLRQKGLIVAVRHYFHGAEWSLWIVMPLAVPAVLMLALAVWGFMTAWHSVSVWLLMGAFLLYFLAIVGPIAVPRYQLPALPLVFVFSSSAFLSIYYKIRAKA